MLSSNLSPMLHKSRDFYGHDFYGRNIDEPMRPNITFDKTIRLTQDLAAIFYLVMEKSYILLSNLH